MLVLIDDEIKRYEELQQPRNLREFKKIHGRSMKETKAICKKSIEQLLELKRERKLHKEREKVIVKPNGSWSTNHEDRLEDTLRLLEFIVGKRL